MPRLVWFITCGPPVGWFVPAELYIRALVAVGEPCLGNLDIIKVIKILKQNIFVSHYTTVFRWYIKGQNIFVSHSTIFIRARNMAQYLVRSIFFPNCILQISDHSFNLSNFIHSLFQIGLQLSEVKISIVCFVGEMYYFFDKIAVLLFILLNSYLIFTW